MSRIAVLGAGYVGLVTAAGLSSLGHEVVVGERDRDRVELLEAGDIPIYERGLPELVAGLPVGLRFDVDNVVAVKDAEFVFLALPTPTGPDGRADTSVVEAVVAEVTPALSPDAILVIKSTVPVGTGRDLADEVSLMRPDVAVVSNPEFLREGSAVEDFLRPDRVVVGGPPAATRAVAALYARLEAPVVETDIESSELIKYASNAYLAARISFVNGLANVADHVGADIEDVTRGMGLDARIGPHFLRPGPGYGGSCFPKDTAALAGLSRDAGYDFDLLGAVIEADAAQRRGIVGRLDEMVEGLAGRTIGVWGISFKAHTDDTRESPALKLIEDLLARGAIVQAHDPVASLPPLEGAVQVSEPLDAVGGADALLVATEWPAYGSVDLGQVAEVMVGDVVFDGRNLLSRSEVRAAGLVYQGVGRR